MIIQECVSAANAAMSDGRLMSLSARKRHRGFFVLFATLRGGKEMRRFIQLSHFHQLLCCLKQQHATSGSLDPQVLISEVLIERSIKT